MGKEISQKLVGQALGITEQRFGSIEQPLNTPTLKTVLQIADVLGVTADDLYKIKHLEKEEYKRLRVLRHTVNGFEEVEGLSELYVIYDKLTIDLNNCHDKSEKKEINIKIKKALADIREVSKLNKCILKREHHIDVENYELWLKYNN
jgi:transcriptional regulator with XRE-family HTH domain